MLTVEDLLEKLQHVTVSKWKKKITSSWDVNFINDVASKVRNGNSISTGQAKVVLKLIQRYKDVLVSDLCIDESKVDLVLKHPLYRQAPYESINLPREVRYAPPKYLLFRCKYNPNIINGIKKLKGTRVFSHEANNMAEVTPRFNKKHKIWAVEVTESNLDKITKVISRYNFQFDSEVEQFILKCTNAIEEKTVIEHGENEIKITVKNDDFLDAYITKLRAEQDV